MRKQPFSVLLLDEFEKSNPNIWDLFLQVFDDGRLSDAAGQAVDFRHCLIILTSNLGATAHRSLGLGFSPQADMFTTEQIMRAISQTYRPEFQNRLDKVIVFRPLTRELMRGILRKELAGAARASRVQGSRLGGRMGILRARIPAGSKASRRKWARARSNARSINTWSRRWPRSSWRSGFRKASSSSSCAATARRSRPNSSIRTRDGAAADGLGAEPAAPPSALAPMILAPAGTQDGIPGARAEHARIERTLASAEWQGLKTRLSGEMSAPDFWNRQDRFDTLARFALMDRVKAATETAQSLRARLARGTRPPRPYSPELVAPSRPAAAPRQGGHRAMRSTTRRSSSRS